MTPSNEFRKAGLEILDKLTYEVLKWNYGATSAETEAEQMKALDSIIQLID
jgi:hypothetical protein